MGRGATAPLIRHRTPLPLAQNLKIAVFSWGRDLEKKPTWDFDQAELHSWHGPCNFLWGQKFFYLIYFNFANANASERSVSVCNMGSRSGGGSPLVGGLGAKPPTGFEGAEPLAGSEAELQEKFWKLVSLGPRKMNFQVQNVQNRMFLLLG